MEGLHPTIRQMRDRLFDLLEETHGMNIPLQRDHGNAHQNNLRNPNKSKPADFPPELKRKPDPPVHQ